MEKLTASHTESVEKLRKEMQAANTRIEGKIDLVKDRVTLLEGKSKGIQISITNVVAIVCAVAAIIALIISLKI